MAKNKWQHFLTLKFILKIATFFLSFQKKQEIYRIFILLSNNFSKIQGQIYECCFN
jgi:hypothetical protein